MYLPKKLQRLESANFMVPEVTYLCYIIAFQLFSSQIQPWGDEKCRSQFFSKECYCWSIRTPKYTQNNLFLWKIAEAESIQECREGINWWLTQHGKPICKKYPQSIHCQEHWKRILEQFFTGTYWDIIGSRVWVPKLFGQRNDKSVWAEVHFAMNQPTPIFPPPWPFQPNLLFRLISNIVFQPPVPFWGVRLPRRLSPLVCRPPTLWRNAHTIPVHCLIHGSACPGCWECTGQVVGKVCTIPGTAPATWHPASPPCSRPSDPAATASDESGPRSAPNPSQPVENFHLQRLSALISQFCWQVGSAIKISWRDYSKLLSCLREEKGWRRWMGSDQAAAYSAFHTLAGWQKRKFNSKP